MPELNVGSGGQSSGGPIGGQNFDLNTMQGGVAGGTFLAQALTLLEILEAQKREIDLQTKLVQAQGTIAEGSNKASLKQGELQKDQAYQMMAFAITTGVLTVLTAAIPPITTRGANKEAALKEGQMNQMEFEKIPSVPQASVSGNVRAGAPAPEEDAFAGQGHNPFDEPASVSGNVGKEHASPEQIQKQKEASVEALKVEKDKLAREIEHLKTNAIQKGQNLFTMAGQLVGQFGSAAEKGAQSQFAVGQAEAQGASNVNQSTSQQWGSFVSALLSAIQALDALKEKGFQGYAEAVRTGSSHG